jgi:putative ABC transport system ATP-binding protein
MIPILKEPRMQRFFSWIRRSTDVSAASVRRPRDVIRRSWAARLPSYAERAARRRHEKPTLQGRRLTCSFGEGVARTTPLREVSVDLYRGQLVLLMGVSGSGKSTLLSVLSGMLRPDNGSVLVLGEDFWRMTPQAQERFRLRHFGFVFQKPNLIPALTARQQLEMMLRWGEGIPAREARRKAEEVLAKLGLTGRADCRPIQLSGGEQQRVAIGRALIKEPTFIFADEPTSALDHEHGRNVMNLFRATAHERGATVLMVTHDEDLVSYADRVFRLKEGRLAY